MIRQPLRYWRLSTILVSQLTGESRRRMRLPQRGRPAGQARSDNFQNVRCDPPPEEILIPGFAQTDHKIVAAPPARPLRPDQKPQHLEPGKAADTANNHRANAHWRRTLDAGANKFDFMLTVARISQRLRQTERELLHAAVTAETRENNGYAGHAPPPSFLLPRQLLSTTQRINPPRAIHEVHSAEKHGFRTGHDGLAADAARACSRYGSLFPGGGQKSRSQPS